MLPQSNYPYMGMFVISPLDGLQYCRKNGDFFRHLTNFGLNSYADLVEKLHPELVTYCACGARNDFNSNTMVFKTSCAAKSCRTAVRAATTARWRRDQSPQERQEHMMAIKTSINNIPTEVRLKQQEQRVQTALGNGSYKTAVRKRELTCLDRYGDSKYNNSKQISNTKQCWTPEQKQLFLDRLYVGLGNKHLWEIEKLPATWIARRKMLESIGKLIPKECWSEWKLYNIAVRTLTAQIYRKNKHTINPHNYTRSSKGDGYHLDHIIPVSYGYMNNIKIEDIACVSNLQMLPWRENLQKHAKYSPPESDSKFVPNSKQLKILAPGGFENFAGVALMGEQLTITISFTNNDPITVTPNHTFFCGGVEIVAGDVIVGTKLDTIAGHFSAEVVGTTPATHSESVYDVIDTESHTYITNNIISHNCAFLSSEPLLISSLFAQTLKHTEPIDVNHGIKVWQNFSKVYEQPSRNVNDDGYNNVFHNYQQQQAPAPTKEYTKQCIVTCDPSKGLGGDYTVINVVEYPSLVQMMELRSNISQTAEIYKMLRYIWKKADDAGWECMFTVENNSVGEGIVTLYETDEKIPDNVNMVSDSGKQLGMNTNARTKLQSCKTFKEMVEAGKFTIKSADTIREIKTFVQTKGSYAAQPGGHDDTISAWLLVCRVLQEIAAYDADAFQALYEVGELGDELTDDSDDFDDMPMVF